MGKYLITGRGGSGKSTIGNVLYAKGYNVFDSDESPGFVRSEDKLGNPITVDWSTHVDYSQVAFNWQDMAVHNFFAENDNFFLCGSASNQLKYHHLFDKVFVLSLTHDKHEQNLKRRSSDYGKDTKMRAYLLEEQPAFVEAAVKLGAVVLDANLIVEQTVDQLLGQIDDLADMVK